MHLVNLRGRISTGTTEFGLGLVLSLALCLLAYSPQIRAETLDFLGQGNHGGCVRILKEWYTRTDSVDRLDFDAPRSLVEWKHVIEVLRTTTLFSNHTFNQSVLTAADHLDSKEREILLPYIVREYRTLKKEPNRRSMELLLNRMYRPDLRFNSYLESGLAVEEAYRKVFHETQLLIGDKEPVELDEVKTVAIALMPQVNDKRPAFIIGSAPSGRAAISKSDIDIGYVNPKSKLREWLYQKLPERVRLSIYWAYEDSLKSTVRCALELPENRGRKAAVQMHDLTPGDVCSAESWLHFGTYNPFLIEVRHDRVNLLVFEPPSIGKDGQLTYGSYRRFVLPNWN